MMDQSRRSESTVRPSDVGSGRPSWSSDKGEGFAAIGNEEKNVGGEGFLGDRLRESSSHEAQEVLEQEEIARLPTADGTRPGLSTTYTHAKSLRSIRSHPSRAGADGYTLNNEDEKPNNSSDAPADDPYLVRWEGGDTDPMNPRSMTTLRRWCIVLIVSASSLCV